MGDVGIFCVLLSSMALVGFKEVIWSIRGVAAALSALERSLDGVVVLRRFLGRRHFRRQTSMHGVLCHIPGLFASMADASKHPARFEQRS